MSLLLVCCPWYPKCFSIILTFNYKNSTSETQRSQNYSYLYFVLHIIPSLPKYACRFCMIYLIFFLQYRQTLSLGYENVWHWQITRKCSPGNIIRPHGVSLHLYRDPFNIKNSRATSTMRKFWSHIPIPMILCSIMHLL